MRRRCLLVLLPDEPCVGSNQLRTLNSEPRGGRLALNLGAVRCGAAVHGDLDQLGVGPGE